MRRALALCAAVFAACGAAQNPPPATPVVVAAPRANLASDCPTAPGLELHVVDGDAIGEAFGAGGHVLVVNVSHNDDAPATLVGELDVKGALAFEEHTRALALANYASSGATDLRRMALVLHGRVVASLAVRSAMRGRRFRFALDDARALDALDAALSLAVATDRRCFPGR